ncbi:hypothetical protein PCASD_18188 [Puccinia coronata f. sp. avenae]|uniref:Uncharacterized protein n=1 Tax=Puccinia coronata f. sp. avenae TaxID=200324 RepID=A0A2N5T2D0_9BASI|nr:hypothetical protein PCASD_18188 [Puccinia coronata f. sp. avenae]
MREAHDKNVLAATVTPRPKDFPGLLSTQHLNPLTSKMPFLGAYRVIQRLPVDFHHLQLRPSGNISQFLDVRPTWCPSCRSGGRVAVGNGPTVNNDTLATTPPAPPST